MCCLDVCPSSWRKFVNTLKQLDRPSFTGMEKEEEQDERRMGADVESRKSGNDSDG